MKVTALAQWYGSNRMLAEHVGRLMGKRSWVGVPFAGGMCELAHINARTMLVSDLHRHIVNLAMVVGDPDMCRELREQLTGPLFHPDVLAAAQRECLRRERDPAYVLGLAADGEPGRPTLNRSARIEWAADYFRCCWMSRSGTAGTDGEFRGGLSVRWISNGGDSVVRFRNAVASLADWQRVMARCTFVCLDVFDFLAKCIDAPDHGLYLDPPFPGPGDKYTHRFSQAQHRELAEWLACPKACRIVCRFYDVPLVRELYPEPAWTWHHLTGRKQTNADAPEVLLVRNG
jgi:DNA adenine methylase